MIKNNFTQASIKPVYDNHKDVIDFFNLVLGHSVLYRRVSAYFDKRSLSLLSKGIKKLLLNNGKIEFIFSTEISDFETIQDIKNGYKERDANSKNIDIDKVDEQDLLSLKLLIKIGKVDIKIARTKSGIFHDKFGLLYDDDENVILFSGSNNETAAALSKNYESFETSLSWDSSEREKQKIFYRSDTFKALWNNTLGDVDVWPAEHFFHQHFNGSEENNEPSKLIESFQDKIILLDFFKTENKLIINSNKTSLVEYFNSFEGDIFNIYFESISERKLISKNTIDISVILKLYEYILEKSYSYGDSLILTSTFDDLIDSLYLDLSKLSNAGTDIKNKTFFESSKFEIFKNEVNNLLKRPLRDAQIQSSYHLVKLKRTMNFSVPGSGKTASVLGAFAYLLNTKKIDKLIVIGPLNSFKSWKEEYTKVFKDTNKYDIYDPINENSSDIGSVLINDYSKLKIILLNYETLPQIVNIITKFIKPNSLIVFDEIHRVKRIQGTYAKAVIEIAKTIKYRVALTGTPIPNGYLDLFNLFKTLFSEYSASYFGFDEYYLKKIQNKYEKTRLEDLDLNQRINPFFIRITKKDLGVPPANQEKVIKIASDEISKEFTRTYFDSNKNYLLKIAKLIQISSIGKDLINENSILNELEGSETNEIINIEKMDLYESSKMSKALEIIKKLINEDKSVIVWSVFIKTIEIFSDYLSKNNIENRTIYGQTISQKREENINDFNNKKYKVLISNPSTLAESVSLHHACHDAIYFEISFNLSHYLQSKDRIHRLGLNENQQTNYYILQTTVNGLSVDEKIYERLKEKEIIMKNAIDRGDLILDVEHSYDEILNNE